MYQLNTIKSYPNPFDHFYFIENNFPSGPRMMEITQTNKLSTYVQVIPIPVHQDVDLNWLKSLKNFLKSK